MIRYVSLLDRGFVTEPRYYFFGWTAVSEIKGRVSAVDALVTARSYLPAGMNFKIWDMKRDRRTQMLMRRSFRKRLRLLHPSLNPTNLEMLVDQFGPKLPRLVSDLGTHALGGAVDLTIIGANGDELYMGTDHDDLTPRAALNYFEKRRPQQFATEARESRRLLKSVMVRAGFHPYEPEWWHWSFRA